MEYINKQSDSEEKNRDQERAMNHLLLIDISEVNTVVGYEISVLLF